MSKEKFEKTNSFGGPFFYQTWEQRLLNNWIKAACDNNIAEITRLMPFMGAGINSSFQGTYKTALMIAAEFNYVKIAELLVNNPMIQMNHRNTLGQTALMIALEKNHAQIIRIIVERNGATVLDMMKMDEPKIVDSLEVDGILIFSSSEKPSNPSLSIKGSNFSCTK